ncbi:MAG: nuclear transport factor 2 family protein [Deltaproteobacteria bacterium]|nr:nuclear transport factor 2 family protein [Deltaproteobacteria bacterium]
MVAQEEGDRVKRLEDIEAIKKLQTEYAYFNDTLDYDKLSDLFVEDITGEYGPKAKFGNKSELILLLKGIRDKYKVTMMCHHMTTPIIELSGDSATGIWYLFGPFTGKGPEGGIPYWVQGIYHNEYVRGDEKWKFRKIHFKFIFWTPYEDGWVKTPMYEP